MQPIPPTVQQARAHYTSFTRRVLSNAARKTLKTAKWGTDTAGFPVLVGRDLALRFCVSDAGHVYAEAYRA